MSRNPGLLVLDCSRTWRAITECGMENVLLDRDLGGFFDRVWHVHPIAGVSPTDPGERRWGLSRASRLDATHTVIEAPAGAISLAGRFEAANFLLAQGLLFMRLSWIVNRQDIGMVTASDPMYMGLWGMLLSRLHRIPLVVIVNGNYDAIFQASGSLAFPRLLRWRRLECGVARAVLARADLVTVGARTTSNTCPPTALLQGA